MDNLTHSMAGWVLARAGLNRKTAYATPALILAANMPDSDVILPLFGFEGISSHRGFTHGIGGILSMPPILALLLLLLYRWRFARGKVSERQPPMDFGWLVALCYLGAATHPLLDLMNTYGVQLLAPFSDRWFYGDTLFIIDLWIWLVLGGCIFWTYRREKQLREGDIPLSGKADWLYWARPAQVAIAAVLIYIGSNFALSTHVEHLAETAIVEKFDRQPDLVVASEVPVRFWVRNIIWRDGTTLGGGEFNALDGLNRVAIGDQTSETGMDHPAIKVARDTQPHIFAFLYWSRIPVARIEQQDDQLLVKFGDARYQRQRALSNQSTEQDGDEGGDTWMRREAIIPRDQLHLSGSR